MSSGARPALVGRRFLSVTGSVTPKLKNLYDWDWRAGWIRSSTSSDVSDQELQLLLEYDELSWKQRDWFSVYSSNAVSNFPQSEEKKNEKDSEKDKKRKRRKTETDSEDEEKEDFQIFCVEERLTVAHRPNYQGSSSTSGTLYPALIFKPLVDKADLFKAKKLPVEFLSDNKLVFQEYSHLKTVTEWNPSTPGLAVCTRSESEVRKWCEDVAAQRILLTTPSVLVGERLSVYRVEGTTQWYSAFIIGHNQETGEFTVTDDTVLEEHLENPDLVQMRILGEGVVQSILRGESISTAPRRSRASAYRDRLPPPSKTPDKPVAESGAGRVRNRRSSSATQQSQSGKLKPRAKRRVSSESPQKTKNSSEKNIDKRRKSRLKSPNATTLAPVENLNSPESLSGATADKSESQPDTNLSKPEETSSEDTSSSFSDINSASEVKSPLPIRLPTKCKPKTDSDSDSDSRSTKSSASSSGSKVSKVLKKTFKGKAIAIVKPFSNAVTEKKSPANEKQKEIEARLNLYDFGSDEDRDSGQRNKINDAGEKTESLDKDNLEVSSDLVSLKSNSSSSISSIKGIKRIKSVKQGLLSSRRLKLNPELKSVRVRVEKLRNSSDKSDKLKVRQSLAKNKETRLKEKESSLNSGKESPISYDQSEESKPIIAADQNQEKVLSESDSTFRGNEVNVPECKEELASESLIQSNEDSKRDLDKLVPSSSCSSTISVCNNFEQTSSEIQSVSYKSDLNGPTPCLLKNDKIIEIVKSEIFSQPSTLNKDSVPVKQLKLEKSDFDRNEDSSLQHRSQRMEDDSRSDSGVSTLRSDGARSSGDERSGSRSSALSDDRSGSRPSASASAEPDIKIVGTVPGNRDLSSHSPAPHRQTTDPYSYRHKPESSESDRFARHVATSRAGVMADPRHAAAAMSSLSGAQLSALAAAAHYGPGMSGHGALQPHLMPSSASAAALLQYQQLAAAAAIAGIPADALLKQNYPGIPGHLPHPATELLLERERQIAQERDRALRERREQEQRERDRLDKERRERERDERERKEKERMERERAKIRELEIQKERERQAMEDVNRHFELSMELAKKKMGGGLGGGWASLPGDSRHKFEDDRRLMEEHQRRSSVSYSRPPPAHSSMAPGPAKSPSLYPGHVSGYKSESASKHDHHRSIPGAPAGFRVDQSYGGSGPKVSSPSPMPVYHQSQHRGPSPHHRGPSPHLSTSPHPSPTDRYSSFKSGYPGAHSPHPPRSQMSSPSPNPLTSYHKSAQLISPSAKSDPGQTRPPSSGPPPAHGGSSKPLPVSWPPHRLSQSSQPPPPRPASATSLPPPVNGDLAPLDLGSNKRKSELNGGQTSALPQKSARLEPVSPSQGQLHRVTEPSTLGNSVLAAEATPITSVVNTALANTEASIVTSAPVEETSETQQPQAQDEFKYVHKLKKAWIKNFVQEPDNNESTSKGHSSVSSSNSNSNVTSPQLTRSTPSPVGSTKSNSSNKGFPSAVKSASEDLKVNGHDNDNDIEDEDDDFSSDNEDSKPVDKPKPKGKPGPKPKGRPGPKPGKNGQGQARKKARSESDNNSDSEKDSDSSKTSKKSDFSSKKRGRKPGPKKKVEVEEPRVKKLKQEENKVTEQTFTKPSPSQLKKSGDSFLQEASCFEVAPKLNKCRECRASLAQRQKQTMANIFCRFYAFRRLRYTKNGQIAVAGFCDPKQDAQIEDLKLWLPSQDLSPKNMDKENACLILKNLTSQFHSIYKQEQEAELYAEDLTPAWKRVVQGVREMCDVCEATLFNKHWACGKCGFVVCIDCYRARVNGQGASTPGSDSDSNDTKDKDNFSWLLCNNNKSHQLDTLMLTQIIAGDALDEVHSKLKLLTKLNRNKGPGADNQAAVNGWENPDNSEKSPVFKDETDVKEEKDEDDNNSSTLRDLLSSEQKDDELLGWADASDSEVKMMDVEETRAKFDTKHQWLCDGIVLKLEDPAGQHNTELFKSVWKRSQPVIVGKVGNTMDSKLWLPNILAEIPDHNYDPNVPDTSAITHGQTIKKFFDGYENLSKRPVGDNGETLHLRFKENWPAQEDHFAELLPNQYKDMMANLPLTEYTSREGVLNLASRLPDCFVRLDLGPRLWGGYTKATYNLQYNVSDAVHVMVHNNKDAKSDIPEILKSSGCDGEIVKMAESNSAKVGALWHVFHPKDADKIKEFVNNNIKDPKKKPRDPLWIGTMYLKEKMMEKLKTEHGITPWMFLQNLGDGVVIPSGAPYQVKILNSSMYVQSEFVSPEHMKDSMKLSFSDVLNDDRLQVKNVVFHACKDALSVLENPTDSQTEK